MEKFSDVQTKEAKDFGEFLIDMLNNHRDTIAYYLAETALFDWFGHTIKGSANIESYLKYNLKADKHCFKIAQPVRSIGYRDTHVVRYSTRSKSNSRRSSRSPISTSNSQGNNEITPPQCIPPPSEVAVFAPVRGQGRVSQAETPPSSGKRRKLMEQKSTPQQEAGQGDASTAISHELKYVSMDGHVRFYKKSDKKLQDQTRWNRQCKLEVAYCGDSFDNYTIYMLIFQGTMKCRRNLLKEFDSCEPEDE